MFVLHLRMLLALLSLLFVESGKGDDGDGGSGSKDGSGNEGSDNAGGASDEIDDESDDPAKWSPRRAKATIIQQRKSEKKLADDLAAANAKIKEYEDSQKSESEKKDSEIEELTAQVADLTSKLANLTEQYNDAVLRYEVMVTATEPDIRLRDPEDALRYIDLSDVTTDDEGNIDKESVKNVLSALLTEKPYLKAPEGSDNGKDLSIPNRGKGNREGSKPADPDLETKKRKSARAFRRFI